MGYNVGDMLQDRYRIIEQIGEGAMGAVYKAEHCLMQKVVAIKILHKEICSQPEYVTRFKREAQSAASIDHPNVCNVTDFATTENGEFFLVMEYLEGETLTDRLERLGKLHPIPATSIIIQVLSALQSAHNLGIIHRDVKPDNVFLLNKDGADDFVKLLDFGISRNVNEEMKRTNSARLTQSGYVYGTPQYLSPEQALGSTDVDYRCDLYSTGVMFYEMLAGDVPFTGDNILQVLNAHVSTPAPLLQKVDPDIPSVAELDVILQKLMQKKPADRYESASDAIMALETLPCLNDPKALEKMSKIVYGKKCGELISSKSCPAILLNSQVRLSIQSLQVPSLSGQFRTSGEFEEVEPASKLKLILPVAIITVLIAIVIIVAIHLGKGDADPETEGGRPGAHRMLRGGPAYPDDVKLIPSALEGYPPLVADMEISSGGLLMDLVLKNDNDIIAAIKKVENKDFESALEDFNQLNDKTDRFYRKPYRENPNFLKIYAYIYFQQESINRMFICLESLFKICPDAHEDKIVLQMLLKAVEYAQRRDTAEFREKLLGSEIITKMSPGLAESFTNAILGANVSTFRRKEVFLKDLLQKYGYYDQLPEWKKIGIDLRLKDEKADACQERKTYVEQLIEMKEPEAWIALEPYLKDKKNGCKAKKSSKSSSLVETDCQACFRGLIEKNADFYQNHKENADKAENTPK